MLLQKSYFLFFSQFVVLLSLILLSQNQIVLFFPNIFFRNWFITVLKTCFVQYNIWHQNSNEF